MTEYRQVPKTLSVIGSLLEQEEPTLLEPEILFVGFDTEESMIHLAPPEELFQNSSNEKIDLISPEELMKRMSKNKAPNPINKNPIKKIQKK
jgi:hypothetical protein